MHCLENTLSSIETQLLGQLRGGFPHFLYKTLAELKVDVENCLPKCLLLSRSSLAKFSLKLLSFGRELTLTISLLKIFL